MSEEGSYPYRARRIPNMAERFFRLGEGRISGYLAVALGAMSLLAVLCFRYPTYLTTPDLRALYDPDLLRSVLFVGLWLAVAFALMAFTLAPRKRPAMTGLLFCGAAFALGGPEVETGIVEERAVSLGVDWMVLDLLMTACLFVLIEKLAPRYREQAILRPEWGTDLLYFAINHLLVSLLLIASNGFAPLAFGWAVNAELQTLVTGLPMAAQFVLLVLCADLTQYWVHRAFHEIPLLWRFHAIHHSVEHMDWLAGSRSHLLDVAVERSLVMVPLYLLGASAEALNAYVVFAALQAVFIHANVGVPFGPLRFVIATPQYHHWHHSSERPAIDTNFAVHLPLFDWLFGSFHLPGGHWPRHYGTPERLPRRFFEQLVHPFRV